MTRILLVEDEVVIRAELRRLLARHGYDVVEAGSVAEATASHDPRSFDLVLADVRLPGVPGTDLVGRCGGAPVVLITSYATVKAAVDAVKRGAADYLSKPFDHDELIAVLEHHIASARSARGAPDEAAPRESTPPTPDDDELEGMVGGSAAMREVFTQVRKVAPSGATLLVVGEDGTGKETLARAVHRLSPRKHLPFVPVHCAAIPEGQIEGELFGYEQGAGAPAARAGLIEAAEGGTLLLDDIDELPARVQARLLRFLQTGEARRVGGSRTRRLDVRLIAATRRDLAALVREGTFRSDLYFRLRVLELRLPPLRERPGDAVRIAESLLKRRVRAMGQTPLALSAEARAAVAAAPWPGNVRELENAIYRAMVLAEASEIDAAVLGLDDAPHPSAPAAPASVREAEPLSDSLEGYFRRFVLEHQHELTETEIARRLGISRKALWERRQRLGIPRPRS